MRHLLAVVACTVALNLALAQVPSTPPQEKKHPPDADKHEPGKFPLRQSIGATIPKALAPVGPSLAQFDYRKAQVQWVDNRWELHAGDVWLKDFGRSERDAREALRVIQRLQLTQHGTIGQPAPIMEFWLADGKAPQALSTGLRLYSIDQRSLRTEQVNGQWCVRDERQMLFNFGPQKESAQQALDVMRQYGFTQVGYVGYPQPTMIYFLSNPQTIGSHTSLANAASKNNTIPKPGVESSTGKPGTTKTPPPPGAVGDHAKTTEENVLVINAATQSNGRVLRQLNQPLSGDVTRYRFDPRQATIRRDHQTWKLFAGNYVLAEFGTDNKQAQQTLQLIRSYGCDEQCLVGKGTPVCSYFMVNGHLPRGVRANLRGQIFRPEKVTLQQTGQGWAICEGKQTLANFGQERDAAQEFVNAMQRYQADFISPIGPGLFLLARTH